MASKTTISSRNKMALLSSISNHHSNINHQTKTTTTTAKTTTTRIPPRTAIKTAPRHERNYSQVPATSSRIALPRSRLTGSGAGLTPPTSRTETGNGLPPPASRIVAHSARAPSFADSRSSSKVSSVSSINNNLSRQTSLSSTAQVAAVKRQNSVASSYVPDTNVVRKGLAKFSNPIECQRQFQALNSKIRQLNEVNENKEQEINKLQDQLKEALNIGVGYATTVQYFATKLKLDSKIDLERECEQLKSRVDELIVNEKEYENKLETIVDDYKNHLQVEQDLRNDLKEEFEMTKAAHQDELARLKEAHSNELDDLLKRHSELKEELEGRIETLEDELKSKCKDLVELRKEYEILNNNFNKLEESLTKDKDARVKYAQEKINQLQKDVDSLNSVLEMRTEKIHALERDSILLGEAQHELMLVKDSNKALKQQLESMNAALEKKREQYENLLADHEKILQELKRERKERRRMTMRTEQLEFVLNESCASESNIAVLDSSVRKLDTSVDRVV